VKNEATKRRGITKHTVHLTPLAGTPHCLCRSLVAFDADPPSITYPKSPKQPTPVTFGPHFATTFWTPRYLSMGDSAPRQYVPLTCHGHSRPVPHLSFSPLEKEDVYYMISACKGLLATNSFPFPIRPLMKSRSRWQPYASRWPDGRLDWHLPRP
jgi:hypothetical protein